MFIIGSVERVWLTDTLTWISKGGLMFFMDDGACVVNWHID